MNGATESFSDIHALLTERRDVLAKYVGVLEKRYAAGTADSDELFPARSQLFEAELQLAS